MQVEKEHFVDAGTLNADGHYDYYYEGDHYIVTFDRVTYKLRSYSDEPQSICFLTRSLSQRPNFWSRLLHQSTGYFRGIPYHEVEFTSCITDFQARGFSDFKVLMRDGLHAVDVTKLNIRH